MNKINNKNNYISFLNEIKQRIRHAQYEAMKAVNTEIIALYWEIGRSIAEKQANGWGKSIVEQLSKDIQKEFPGIKGFGTSNLWNMAKFYVEYHDDKNLQPMVGEISWAKHVAIMTKCFIAIELKIGEFEPEYKGKMEFYLNIINDTICLPHENPAIGIIICKSKNRTIVEYALRNSTIPIGVATYNISTN